MRRKVLNAIKVKKGITLNSQLVDLLSILDKDIPQEEQDKEINEYLENLRQIQEEYKKAKESAKVKGIAELYKFIIDKTIDSIEGISPKQKEELKGIYMSSIGDMSIFDTEQMEQKLLEDGFDGSLNRLIQKQVKSMDFEAKEGILDLTPEKVRKLHDHIFKDGKAQYDRVTIDNAGKYSSYVGADGESYSDERLDKIITFSEKHGMKSKVNALMFYADFPKNLESFYLHKADELGLSSDEKRDFVRNSLKESFRGYIQDISEKHGGRLEEVDIFNELVYDPAMLEEGFSEPEKTYHERREGWQKYLSLEDLCEMALEARKAMPGITFTYNDVNWVNSEKRKEIIKVIKKIQEIETRYREEGKLDPDERLIDAIGFEAHLTTANRPEEIEKVLDEVEELCLPVKVTELDVARVGDNPKSPEEIAKQAAIVQKIIELSEEGRIEEITFWSQSDELSFVNDKCGRMVHASAILDENCEEKEYELAKDIEIQPFNYHTHTNLCGHANGTMEEYIDKAIERGIAQLGFADHMPSAFGKTDPGAKMSMEQFYTEYIPQIEALKKKYVGKIDIKAGLECEYYGDEAEQYPQIREYRDSIEPKLDYMILGQHFALKRNEDGSLKKPPEMSDKNSIQYPLDYAMTVVEAIRSGKFAYVAHPDIFLEARDNVPESEREAYNANALRAAHMICEAAKEYDVPLEVNLGAIAAVRAGEKSRMKNGSYAYPVTEFWKIAQKYGCKCLIGVDAHTPEMLKDKSAEEIAKTMLLEAGIELDFLESFDPVAKREKHVEKHEEEPYCITEAQVGKATINQSVGDKDFANQVVSKNINERDKTKETQTHNQ